MIKMFKSFLNKEDGATAIEYGLIAAGIAVAVMATVFLLGGDLDAMFGEVQTQLAAR